MPLEINPELKQVLIYIMQWLGIPSLAGFLGLYGAWLAFPPELVIDGVIDKSKIFSSESRIKIKNNGRLPAYTIKADLTNLCAKFPDITLKDCGVRTNQIVVARLSHGETSEVSLHHGLNLGDSRQTIEFSYVLTLRYQVKLFFLQRESSKKWQVTLKTIADGFYWDLKII